jgi:hypothetical protein
MPRLTRRAVVKMLLVSVWGALLSACEGLFPAPAPSPTDTLTPTPTPTPTPSLTSTPTPTDTSTPTSTPTNTSTPADTPIPCFVLVGPEDGAELPAVGRVTFEWTPQFGSVSYRLEITRPNGKVLPHETEEKRYTMYNASLPWGGEFSWQVVALDGDGREICVAGPRSFTKPEFVPTATPTPTSTNTAVPHKPKKPKASPLPAGSPCPP